MGVGKYTPNDAIAGDMGWKPAYIRQWSNVFRHKIKICPWYRGVSKMHNFGLIDINIQSIIFTPKIKYIQHLLKVFSFSAKSTTSSAYNKIANRVRIFFLLSCKAQFFFQNSTLGYMTKTLNQIIFFFLHQNQNTFFSNIGNIASFGVYLPTPMKNLIALFWTALMHEKSRVPQMQDP
jgi:hypothetical protein